MDNSKTLILLNHFIVNAKKATYVGSGEPVPACRLESHDLEYIDGEYSYRDSYFGGQNFLGEEIVWYQGKPVWGENYYGKVIHPELISAAEAGQMIKTSLTEMYSQGRFLGGFRYEWKDLVYIDENSGDPSDFQGKEDILRNGLLIYRLYYHGGVII